MLPSDASLVMSPAMKIVLFEDTPESAQLLLTALRAATGGQGTVELFESADVSGDGTYEERLITTLSAAPYANATLIVADRDLSKTDRYRGLSESVVRRAADRLATPQCSYSRGGGMDLLRAAEEREALIAVSIAKGEQACAADIVEIAIGFMDLQSKLATMSTSANRQSAGKTLGQLLNKPEYSDKLALYASGDRNRPGHVLHMFTEPADEQVKRLTCLFGYWLWDSVLQYPGVVANAVAAASYLNILTDTFCNDPDIQSLFADARYRGPFAKAKEPLWWRGMLDDMVAREQLTDGRELASQKLKKDIAQSQCCEEPSIPAGYYCMLSGRAVSLKNSRPGLAWFPRGADLARLSQSRFEELGPWL
jgi:hypothetical protein